MDNEALEKALINATNNFTKGFYMSTLMGWTPLYDKQGRAINSDPNYKTGDISINGKKYFFIKKGWIVNIWEEPRNYSQFYKEDQILKINLKPDYIEEFFNQ